MLDRLMGRPVFTDMNTVMRENEKTLKIAQRRKTNRWTHVIRKHQKRRAKGNPGTVQSHAVDDGAHRVLTDTEMNIASRKIFRRNVSTVFDRRFAGRGQIR